MFRSLHMKLVLIMVLLIVSLMTVVGAFLMNSVVRFYINDFYQQINQVTQQTDFTSALVFETEAEAEGSVSAVQMLEDRLRPYVGELGVDGRNRNYYILDGTTAKVLLSSDSDATAPLSITPNIEAALQGRNGVDNDMSADYMDVALCFTRGERSYIFYILDLRGTVRSLNGELFSLILEALMLGLVISALLSLLLSKTMTTPIERLTDGAKRVAAGDFGHKLEVSSRDEIGVLTDNFNSMSRRLQDTLAAVENERNKLNTLFLYMTDGVVAFGLDGRIIHWNPAAMDMLGRRIDDATVYSDLFDAPPPVQELLEREDGYVEQSIRAGARHLECICALFDRGNQEGVLVVIHDVTEQRRVEEQRREFVANVSHELRTPLTNIRSYAETLAGGTADMPPEMEQSFLNVILNESDRMTHIVSDLLTLSRFDSGHSELKLDQFSFSQAVGDTYRAVLLDAQSHGHTVLLDLEPDIPDIVGDRERILQVIMNIVSNAIKYTPEGGLIRLTAGRTGDRVWLEVDDNGIGIPAEDRGRIFERFYRVDKARSRQSGGTGLGLSIAKEIVDRHQGTLSLVDKAEPGLTVRLELNVDGPREERT